MNEETITIIINGEEHRVPVGLSIRDLLAHLALHERMVVVEKNEEIVRRNRFADMDVEDGDRFELVHFVGGG